MNQFPSDNSTFTEVIGYCSSCKDTITSKDEFVRTRKKLYCLYCYNTEHDIVPELNFE